jgi:hypothetical protein
MSCTKNHEINEIFTDKLPRDTAVQYCNEFGDPESITKNSAIWSSPIRKHDIVEVKNEQIPHSWPMAHVDFVYSTRSYKNEDGSCDITPEHVGIIAKATGSIFVDQLKCEATARCHYLIKNDVSLRFVQDIISGEKITTENARDMYAEYILNNKTTDEFPDPFDNSEKTLIKKHADLNSIACPNGYHYHPDHPTADNNGCMRDEDM